MRQRHCRYSTIVTGLEFVAVYRVPGYHGSLRISDPFRIVTADVIRNGRNVNMPANVTLLGLALLAHRDFDPRDDDGADAEFFDDHYDKLFPLAPEMQQFSSPLRDSHSPSEYL
jgi:hypothetical protein